MKTKDQHDMSGFMKAFELGFVFNVLLSPFKLYYYIYQFL